MEPNDLRRSVRGIDIDKGAEVNRAKTVCLDTILVAGKWPTPSLFIVA